MVNWYAETLRWLPAIEINQRNEIIDGYMRWLAHKRAKAPTIRVRVTEVASDLEHRCFAFQRNSKHGIPMIDQFDIEFCRQFYREREAEERLALRVNNSAVP
jgi:hypothetical protein